MDAPLKVSRSATISSASSSVTTHTSSTASAPAVPITVVTASEDYHMEGGQMVDELLDQVVSHAANSMLAVELKHSCGKRAESFSNLQHLQDSKEEKLNLLNLKYPSAYSLNVKGLVEESADNVEKALDDLISAASKVNAGKPQLVRRTVINHDDAVTGTHPCADYARPVTTSVDLPVVASDTSLQAVSSSTLMNSDTSSSRSTQNFQDILSIQDTSSTHLLHRAFSNLEHQLYQERKEALMKHKSVDKDIALIKKDLPKDYIQEFRNSLGLPGVHSVPTRSKEETNYLFEEILRELEDNHHLCNQQSNESNLVSQLTPLGHQHSSLEPSVDLVSHKSSTSHDTPVSCDLTANHVITTTHCTKSPDPVSSHDFTGIPTSCGVTTNDFISKSPDPVASHDFIGSHETVSVVTTCEHTASLSTDQDDQCRRSSMGTVMIPYDMAEDEPGATALKQLVTISSNEECLGRIVAHVCLPTFSSKLLQLSQWQCSSAGLLSNIAALLYNLFEVIISLVAVRLILCICRLVVVMKGRRH